MGGRLTGGRRPQFRKLIESESLVGHCWGVEVRRKTGNEEAEHGADSQVRTDPGADRHVHTTWFGTHWETLGDVGYSHLAKSKPLFDRLSFDGSLGCR